MAGPKTDKAFVIKRMAPSTASYLLVVKKELLVGNFASSPLAPQIGAIIVIDYRRHSENDKNKIDVCSWNPYDGYNAMVFRLAGKATDKELKFCGSFYTCGHIRYKGEPLSHPAIFNDFIGVVEDKHDILDKNYIGKLWATVMYCETSDSTWELCCIDKYLGKTNKIPLPYSGIVGAVNQGPDKNMNYITSRDFPHDVRFFSGTNVGGKSTASLLGHEVIFYGCKEGPSKKFYVLGNIEVTGNDIPKIYGSFFSLKLMVENIGCTDEHGGGIVWSDRWEFITDSHDLFRDREHGVYMIEAIRHHRPDEFPRWKVKSILKVVDSYAVERKHVSVPSSNRSPCPSVKQIGEGNEGVRSSPCHSVIQLTEDSMSKRVLHVDKDEFDGRKDDSGVHSEEMEDSGSPQRPSSGECRAVKVDLGNGDLRCRSNIDEQAERELHDHMHRCLASIKVRAAMKQANPKLFDDLVKALMHV